MSSGDRVVEGVEPCELDGCDDDRYPGWSRCLKHGRQRLRTGK